MPQLPASNSGGPLEILLGAGLPCKVWDTSYGRGRRRRLRPTSLWLNVANLNLWLF
jgi:hypothetical protein